ncbi:AAA family ATPase [Clostridioides difficile]|uniref:AAA family ATPase n=1 Tax=Clostridioides difficile TaxID=1496 RepID=UPI00038DA57A|nr:AAA family ATPase [Clostridioides difficile]EQH77352.1 recF/RecN/SMC N terminal domain protein [Clostridioides difficile DA00305]
MRKLDNIKKGTIILDIIPNSANGRDAMKIEKIEIKGIGGIKELSLRFNKGLNIICGANGIGKTTILEVISHLFSIQSSDLKKNAKFDLGEAIADYSFEDIEAVHKSTYQINDFNASVKELIFDNRDKKKYSKFVLFFKTHRELNYSKLDGITGDETYSDDSTSYMADLGIDSSKIKNWFINRLLFSKQEGSLTKEQLCNLDLAIEMISILDKNVSYSRIVSDSLDLMINTPQGEIYIEYLSSGYKSCFYILLGIIKELEYRFTKPYIEVKDFDGVILIDELDLHLHPEWQVKIVNALKVLLPKARIIATTHSPNMIQTLSPDEIIPLTMDENGNVRKKDLELGEYGLQGWTIEEILTDVMGMKTTSSELYLDTMKKFDRAMDKENVDEIKKYYDILMKMLHPNSTLRTILKIQVAGIID